MSGLIFAVGCATCGQQLGLLATTRPSPDQPFPGAVALNVRLHPLSALWLQQFTDAHRGPVVGGTTPSG